MERIPEGFAVRKIAGLPSEVEGKRMGKWLWLRERLSNMSIGDFLQGTCSKKHEMEKARSAVKQYFRKYRKGVTYRTWSMCGSNGSYELFIECVKAG